VDDRGHTEGCKTVHEDGGDERKPGEDELNQE
jgi:hypothetical protein